MTGLMSNMPQQAATEQVDEETPNVSPEEQAQYDQFVDNCYKMIYSAQGFPKIMERLTASNNPIEGLATAVSSVVFRAADSARKAGFDISPDVLFHGGFEVLNDLADTARKVGVHEYTDQEVQDAWYAGLDMYLKQDPGQQQQAQADLQQLIEADKAGQLDQLVPGATQAAQALGARAQQQPQAQPPQGAPPMQQGGM